MTWMLSNQPTKSTTIKIVLSKYDAKSGFIIIIRMTYTHIYIHCYLFMY